jgi:hypothetical protein
VDPPATDGVTFDAAGATRRNCRVDGCAHLAEPTHRNRTEMQHKKSTRFDRNERNQMRWRNQRIMRIDAVVRAPARVDS